MRHSLTVTPIDPFWLVLFSATLAAYAILKIMKNKKMLHVAGR